MGCTQKNAKRRNYVVDEDRLSQLPDEIIANILSRLPIKESGRTSVLSRRWEKLWLLTSRCSGRNLVFSCPIYNELYRRNCDYIKDPIVDRKRLLYIGLLNKVFKCHQQPLVDELVISLHLNSTFSSVIDEWLKFAFSKGVKRLELNLSYCSYLFKWGKPYAFPSPHNEYFRASGIHRLRVLCLKGVYINQEVVDALLSTFPLLESLSLQPKKLRDLKISCDKMLKLKHLEVFGPLSAKKRIQISAPYLVSLRYEGSMRALHLKCITRLSEFYVHDTDRHAFFMRINLHRSFISQLKKLKLFMCLQMFMRCTSYPLAFPELVKLEEMEVSITGCDGDSFLWPTVFIKASPLLHRFAIELKAYEEDDERCHSERDKRRLKESTRCRHKFLKVVEISKFRGMRSEMELAQHLFDIGAQSLEKVVIDTRTVFVTDEDAAEEVRKLARSAGQGLDSNVEFVVL